jgi:hypothetical protein
MIGRYASLKTLLRFLPLIVVFGLMSQRTGNSGGLLTAAAFLCLFGAAFTILLGPQLARNDLRQDLGNLAVLKTWPLTGSTLLRGELLAPLVLLTAIAWLLILSVLMLSGQIPIAGAMAVRLVLNRLSYAVAAMLAAPALILAQLVVQNGFAIAFPAWVTIGTSQARGVEVMGQRMLMLAANAIALVLFLLPGAIVAAVVSFALYAITHSPSAVMAAFTLALVMGAECWLAVEALGRVLDRTDVNAVDARE